jgi:hypothetical protein
MAIKVQLDLMVYPVILVPKVLMANRVTKAPKVQMVNPV